MNYYKRHIGDYLRDTAHLNLLEHGIYSRLLDVYYIHETGIPAEQAARLIGARSEDERMATAAVLAEFFMLEGEVWRQKRCDEEIAKASAKAENNRKVGMRGGRPASAEEPRHNPDGFQAEPKPNPDITQMVSENNPTPLLHYSTTPLQEIQDLAPTVHSRLAAPKRPAVPVAEIVDLYHQTLPMCPQVRKLTEARRKQLEARWRCGDLPDLDTWRAYFEFCAESKFLTGLTQPANGHKHFVADLEWLSREGNYAKIYEGKYHR